jgi:3-hydroxyisobutyrate dehydrogenase-like beta-hydroxyacid dehydrogenase
VDVLILCVSDDAAVGSVLFGRQGAATSLPRGSVVLDCSTIAPSTAVASAERLLRQGVNYIDAPVTGGTEGARAGTLTVLAGGDAQALERVRPLLSVIGGTVHHFGAVGRGQQVKAVNQVLVAGSYAAVAEAMALGARLDLPMQDVVVALSSGAAGSWALSHRAEGMLAGHYPLGFRLTLHHKDLCIALKEADSVQLTLPISSLVQQQEAELIAAGHGDEDVSALHRLFDAES